MDKKEVAEAIKKAIEDTPKRKFSQSIEMCVNFTGINMEDSRYKLNTTIFLPKGRGREIEVGIFAEGDMYVRAKKISKYVLNKNELEEMAKNRRKMRSYANKCYGFIAQPDLMPLIGKSWGVVLGPRNKMPQPVPPNSDLKPVTDRMKNTVRLRTKKFPTLHVPVGNEKMSPEDLAENVLAVYTGIERQIPEDNIKSIYVKATMGKSMKVM